MRQTQQQWTTAAALSLPGENKTVKSVSNLIQIEAKSNINIYVRKCMNKMCVQNNNHRNNIKKSTVTDTIFSTTSTRNTFDTFLKKGIHLTL
jgi:hypothetical protein